MKSQYLLLVTFASKWLKTHGFRRKLLFKLCLGQSHRGSGMHGPRVRHEPCCRPAQRKLKSGCCRWARLSTAWLQSWDHRGLNLNIMGDCCSVMFLAWFLLSCGHKPRTAWNSLWTFMNPSGRDKPHWINVKSFQNCLSNKVIRTDLTPCRAHRLVPPWLQHKSEQ